MTLRLELLLKLLLLVRLVFAVARSLDERAARRAAHENELQRRADSVLLEARAYERRERHHGVELDRRIELHKEPQLTFHLAVEAVSEAEQLALDLVEYKVARLTALSASCPFLGRRELHLARCRVERPRLAAVALGRHELGTHDGALDATTRRAWFRV